MFGYIINISPNLKKMDHFCRHCSFPRDTTIKDQFGFFICNIHENNIFVKLIEVFSTVLKSIRHFVNIILTGINIINSK